MPLIRRTVEKAHASRRALNLQNGLEFVETVSVMYNLKYEVPPRTFDSLYLFDKFRVVVEGNSVRGAVLHVNPCSVTRQLALY